MGSDFFTATLYTHPMVAGKAFVKTALHAFVIIFVLTAFLGASHWGMDVKTEGAMGLCPFMPGVVICNMTPLEHISAAQSMFNTLPQDKNVFVLLILLLAAAISISLLYQWKLLFPPVIQRIGSGLRREDAPLLRPLQEAFSNGIIHSRAF